MSDQVPEKTIQEKKIDIRIIMGMWIFIGILIIGLGCFFLLKYLEVFQEYESYGVYAIWFKIAVSVAFSLLLLFTFYSSIGSFLIGYGFKNPTFTSWKRSLILSLFIGIVFFFRMPIVHVWDPEGILPSGMSLYRIEFLYLCLSLIMFTIYGYSIIHLKPYLEKEASETYIRQLFVYSLY
ncbi:MAG: hypothetical protein ACFFC6_09095 [Promethearchaeota archaeon]